MSEFSAVRRAPEDVDLVTDAQLVALDDRTLYTFRRAGRAYALLTEEHLAQIMDRAGVRSHPADPSPLQVRWLGSTQAGSAIGQA